MQLIPTQSKDVCRSMRLILVGAYNLRSANSKAHLSLTIKETQSLRLSGYEE